MSDRFRSHFWGIIERVIALAILGAFGLWIRAEVQVPLRDYVTAKEHAAAMSAIDERLRRVEDALANNYDFQREVLQRLARIEAKIEERK